MTVNTGADTDPVVEPDHELVGIVAVADNGVIGKDGDMPWHIPEDLQHFKETTMAHPVIMGRVTYESIVDALGEPLPGRTTVVLTSRDLETPENAVVAHDLQSAVEEAAAAADERHDGADRVFVAGGATVYEQYLPALDRLIVTEVHEEPDGDTQFPDWDRTDFDEVERDEHDGFAFVEYVRTP
ncbi:dihydrofolate reductase [Natrialba magadii ATCC 43099]|uniref:dihydrofolate reductase n=1 Tax=Natrialba magadii (strain ATCC 43099 / DSM 3394 / CCM 3739 / CIP 104546 / IAM 13178 / JCM 8861 / NBRC 102185 / NCIMB 2190 / MS3) TaxID=547559 RepID=D3SQY4_NATMM|nr:dihydrofolate reductase [Natrialba magadii]ADD06540.1 dihydrofolate reductase [Natrialba magadii ATCC 43099]ELY31997.1 dihydrofolate reductase [Natrialba magadii ATCC 43099]